MTKMNKEIYDALRYPSSIQKAERAAIYLANLEDSYVQTTHQIFNKLDAIERQQTEKFAHLEQKQVEKRDNLTLVIAGVAALASIVAALIPFFKS